MQRILAALALVLTLSLPAGAAPTPEQAVSTVERLNEALVATMMDGPSLGFQGRVDRLEPVIRDVYLLERIAQLMTQPWFQKAPAPERQALVEAVARESVATYAARFDRFLGHRFTIEGTRPGPRGTLLVDTTLALPVEDPIALTYVVEERDGRIGIIDVLLRGQISQLSLKRSDYAATLKAGGLPALSRLLDERVQQLRAE